MHVQNLKCQNEGFRCDPQTSVRANLILLGSCDGNMNCVIKVLKLTLNIDLKERKLFIQKFLLQNCSIG